MQFILTADWHLREDKPRCRKDEDWIATQEKALNQVRMICNDRRLNLFVVGDMFHRSTEYRMVRMVQKVADELSKSLYFLAGNHDLKYHSSLNLDSSCISLLSSSHNCFKINDANLLNGFDSINAPNFDETPDENARYLFIHTLCFPDMKSMPPNVNAVCAKDLLEEYPNAEWIFTGDYHRNFHYEWKGRHVVNSGCLLRQASDMKDYQCGVYFIDTDSGIVEFIPIIDSEKLVDDSYIVEQKERDERIEGFVSKLSETQGISLDFADNVEKALLCCDLEDGVKDTIRELMGA